ncbi:MAG: VWA domain-containing protein [Bryobacteraceae bacterium]|nr:VWA domain-containing protein [Bryobacteraceae bacterium]MDW8378132.1 VWA domain-containing protein [Bryobacterales bacterium]
MRRICLLLVLGLLNAQAAMRVLVTVVEQKTSRPITDLQASDFTFLEDKLPRRVEAAEFASKPIDVMLLVDTSLVGPMVQPIAGALIAELKDKEQMAIVAFDSSAEMIQDFTSSKETLHSALGRVKYGNTPRVLDALFAAMESGFDHATFRRVIFLVTTGFEGGGRVSEREVVRLARRQSVSIYPIYAVGGERGLFESLARQTGGASFNLRELARSAVKQPAQHIFEVARGAYTLTLTGNLGLGEKLKVEVKRPQKLFVSALPLD